LIDTNLEGYVKQSHVEVTTWSSAQWKPTPWSKLWVVPVLHVKQHSLYFGIHRCIHVTYMIQIVIICLYSNTYYAAIEW